MIHHLHIACPNLKRKINVDVSIPKRYEDGVVFDTLYMLDGQNIFKDAYASFGTSMHMGRYFSILAQNFNKRVCGVAIYNAQSDLGRLNEYTPWKLEGNNIEAWNEQDPHQCELFTKDLIEVIIPTIQKKFPVSKNSEDTFIFGSSLGALYAHYVANLHPEIFGVVGLFSICPFLCKQSFEKFCESSLNPKLRNFIYVGLNESSDGEFDQTLYYNSAKELHEYLKYRHIPSHLLIDVYGYHYEGVWEKHVMQFLSYIYFEKEDMEICI